MGVGAAPSGGTLTEDQVEFGGDPLAELALLVNAGGVPKGGEGDAQLENLEALLGITPVIGNVLSAKDAYNSAGDFTDAVLAGDKKGMAIHGGLTGLNAAGAVLGLPFGKAAGKAAKAGKDSVNVFVPSVDDAAADRARDMRASGKPNNEVWKDTGRVFGSEGGLREEIFDTDMKVDVSKLRPDEQVRVGDVVKHPELFEHEAWLKDLFVRGAGTTPEGVPLRTARNDLANTLILPSNPEKATSNMAKLFQYNIADRYGLPKAMRHDVSSMRGDLAKSAEKAASARYETPQDLEALAAYMHKLDDMRGLLDKSSGTKFGSQLVTSRSAGNVEAKHASQRADIPRERLEIGYPYSRNRHKGGADRVAAFENLFPLIRENASPEEVQSVIQNWYKFGSGKDASVEDLDALLAKFK